ncbi:MAG: glycosyltransferase family 39 protein [Actinobacteria bacterium]|nr:glycosyltransferase family 39 protein [Actinomycetota bacterium]
MPRRHVAVLLAIALVGLVRGLFWVTVVEITSPIDEAQHIDYVVSLATRGRPPIVGTDTLHPDLLRLLKSAPTSTIGRIPVSVEEPAGWAAVAQSYEGVQPPLYYAVLTPAYLALRDAGIAPVVFALRLASLLLALTAVPLIYVLARELFPERPAVWLGGPLLLVFVQGFNANLATVNNDALIVPLGVATLIPVARAIRRGITWRQAVATGTLFGLGLLTKATAVGLAVVVALGALLVAGRQRPPVRTLVGWPAVVGGIAAVLIAPWVVWNLVVYGATSGAVQAHAITGALQLSAPVTTLAGLADHVEAASLGFWDMQLLAPAWNAYTLRWTAVFLAAVAGGLVVTLIRGRQRAAARLGWLAVATPAAFLGMLAVIVGAFGGVGLMVGRHLYGALGAAVLAVAGGIGLALPARWAAVTLLAVVAFVTGAEPPGVHRYLDATYVRGVVAPDLAPVVDQTWNDEWIPGEPVRLSAPCQSPAFTLTFEDRNPTVLTVAGGGSAQRVEEVRYPIGFTISRYRLDAAVTEAVVEVPPWAHLGWSRGDRTPHLEMVHRGGDPVGQILCPVDDPGPVRFEQTFDRHHPDAIDYGPVRAWPLVWVWATRAAALGALLGALVRAGRRRRSGSAT